MTNPALPKLYKRKEVAAHFRGSYSLLCHWATVMGYQQPQFIKLGTGNGGIRYPDDSLLRFLSKCVPDGTELPETYQQLLPFYTPEMTAEYFGVTVNALHHNQDFANLPFFRIHPDCDFNKKGQGLIRFSHFHILRKVHTN